MLLMLLVSGVGNELGMTSSGPSVVGVDPFARADSFAHAIGCTDEFCVVCDAADVVADAELAAAAVGDSGGGLVGIAGFLSDSYVAGVANEIPVDSDDGVSYIDSCAGYVRSSHDDAPGNRVADRHASTERSDTDRAALSRSHLEPSNRTEPSSPAHDVAVAHPVALDDADLDDLGVVAMSSGFEDDLDDESISLVTSQSDEQDFWAEEGTSLRVRVGKRTELSPAMLMLATVVVALTMWAGVPLASADSHEVTAGDTLWTIAATYGVSVDELIALNEIDNPANLRIGDLVLLPEPPYEGATLQHIVQPGETLTAIAGLYDVEADAILRLNELADANRIRAAEVLEIPDLSVIEEQADDEYVVVDVDYTVAAGDTLSQIADAHDVEVGDIVRASGLLSANIIREGQTLSIPTLVVLSPTERHAAMFETWAEANDLDPNLMKALGWQESRWQPDAVSYAGAVGMTQIMPGTRDYIADELIGIPELSREDAEENIRMGSRYLAYLLELSKGDLRLALGSYYQGFTSVTRNGYRADTVRYIDSILGYVPRFESGELPG